MISAIVLAAGESRRMGRPKMLLPWGKSTVLQTVIATFQAARVKDILVVTGGAHTQVEALIGQTVQTVFNGKLCRGRDAKLNSDRIDGKNARGAGRFHCAR